MTDKVKKVLVIGVRAISTLWVTYTIAEGAVCTYQLHEFRKILGQKLKEEKLKEEEDP